MYHISENSLDSLIQESQNISERLNYGGKLLPLEIKKFGVALISVQTEIRTGIPYVEAEAVTSNILTNQSQQTTLFSVDTGDAISCFSCGGIMQRAGSCYCCTTCGNTSGCS